MWEKNVIILHVDVNTRQLNTYQQAQEIGN